MSITKLFIGAVLVMLGGFILLVAFVALLADIQFWVITAIIGFIIAISIRAVVQAIYGKPIHGLPVNASIKPQTKAKP